LSQPEQIRKYSEANNITSKPTPSSRASNIINADVVDNCVDNGAVDSVGLKIDQNNLLFCTQFFQEKDKSSQKSSNNNIIDSVFINSNSTTRNSSVADDSNDKKDDYSYQLITNQKCKHNNHFISSPNPYVSNTLIDGNDIILQQQQHQQSLQQHQQLQHNNNNPHILYNSAPNLYFSDVYYAQLATFSLPTLPSIELNDIVIDIIDEKIDPNNITTNPTTTTTTTTTTPPKPTIVQAKVQIVVPIADLDGDDHDDDNNLNNPKELQFSQYPFLSISALAPNLETLTCPPK